MTRLWRFSRLRPRPLCRLGLIGAAQSAVKVFRIILRPVGIVRAQARNQSDRETVTEATNLSANNMKSLLYALPPDLCFPRPLFRIDGHYTQVNRDAVSSYLTTIRSWRLRALEVLRNAGAKELSEVHYLSPKAQEMFASFLACGWMPEMSKYAAQSTYNLRAFSPHVLEDQDSSTVESVLDVLRWRAGIVDYLGDAAFAWNPTLEMDECAAIGRFFHPDDHKKLCWLCLTEFAPEQRHLDGHECALTSCVRAKWPQTPSAFRAWAKRAKNSP